VTDPSGPVAVLATVGLVLLLVERAAPTISDRPAGRRGPALVVALGVGGAVLLTRPDRVMPTLVAAGACGAGLSLWRRRRRRREAQLVAERVREACEHLSAELAAGLPSGDALDQVARSWHPLSPVAEAHRIGADVPDALRRAALQPGAGDLRLLAAAWQVAHRTGQGLAASVDRVSGDLAAARRTRRVVEGELASARATARLVAGLPALAWAMGSGAGGDPVGFLLGTPLGWGCLALGSAFGLAGLWWIEAIARDVDGPA
jgi:tight adherence protein B